MPIAVDGASLEQEPVGAVLAQMRRARRITGAELAVKVGMSQPKISRIERGRGMADPEDIGVIARALGADEALVRSLMERAEQSLDRMTDWRPTFASRIGGQESMAECEAAAQIIRDFQPAVLNGLLQTSGYARAMLLPFRRLVHAASDDNVEGSILAAVTARIRRQEILADPTKSFQFVLTEALLRNQVCPPVEMLAQISHLRVLASRPNVEIAVICDGAPIDLPPLHGFTLLDDSLVAIDVYNTSLTSRGRNDVERYGQVFDLFHASATVEIGPLLDRYQAYYIEQLRTPADGRH